MHMPDPARGQGIAESPSDLLVQRRVDGPSGREVGAAPPIVHEVLSSPGQPLDATTRAFFEPRFAHDLGQVRIHADDHAAKSAQVVNALAYTVGRDVVFGPGRYSPQAPQGRRLLAHELSHVIQQGGSRPGSTLRRTPGAGSVPEKAVGPVSLSTGITGTHEIVINGEPFDLAVMSATQSLQDAMAEEYMGSYPNLGSGLWAFIVKQGVVRPGDKPYCPIGGNCLGWAYGGTRDVDPSERVWGLVPQFFESIGLTDAAGSTSVGAYLNQAQANKFPAPAIWDYFMNTEFQAMPTDSDADANVALYGRGFAGTPDGPTHIAFRTAGGELWVSKPSPYRYPLVHEQASQMSGGQTGDVVRLYKRVSGPLNHVVLRAKQAQPSQ
ncbi:MAG: DUF4157 domain-containing protein [Nitrospira defluvii]|nr:DUF4157 domain-containing protein [Nitrospira defluvii]